MKEFINISDEVKTKNQEKDVHILVIEEILIFLKIGLLEDECPLF